MSKSELEKKLGILERYYIPGFLNKFSALILGIEVYIDDGSERGLEIAKECLSWLINRYNGFNGSNSFPEYLSRIKHNLREIEHILNSGNIEDSKETLYKLFNGIDQASKKYTEDLESVKEELRKFPEYQNHVFASDRDNPERWKVEKYD